MFFKKQKEIEKLKYDFSILESKYDALKRSNAELSEKLDYDHVDPVYCAVCAHGIAHINEYGYYTSAKCILKCNCTDFKLNRDKPEAG